MSKYVKNLVTDHLRQQLADVGDALVVNVVGLDANSNCQLRSELADRGISLLVIKNSLAQRATEGTVLAPAFEGLVGPAAVAWGSEDIVSLAKSVVELAGKKEFEGFEARGGAMGGEALSAEKVKEVSKWPSRQEQLSMLVAQVLGPGAALAAQLGGPAGMLASQVKQKSEEGEGDDAS